MDGPILTPRLLMRPFAESDLEAVFAVFSDPEVGRWVGGTHETRERSREMIARNVEHQRENGFSMWAVEERGAGGAAGDAGAAGDRRGAFVGEVGLQLLELAGPEVEIGWALARSARGRGYATEAAHAWLGVAFTTLGLDEVIATVLPENEASHRVAERLGMERLPGRRRVHRADHVIWRIRRAASGPA